MAVLYGWQPGSLGGYELGCVTIQSGVRALVGHRLRRADIYRGHGMAREAGIGVIPFDFLLRIGALLLTAAILGVVLIVVESVWIRVF